MPDWKQKIRERLAGLRLEPAREAEVIAELADHLEDRYQELRAAGLPEDEAGRLVLSELSDSDLLSSELRKTECMETREVGGNPIADLWQDLRYGLSTLRKNPGFTAFVALTLGLGIGSNTTVFTIINTLLLNPLPVRKTSELAAVY